MPEPARIWVVDDDRAVRFVLAAALREAGFEVVAFAAAGEALDALQRGPLPALVLTDVRMPGDSGLVLLERLKAERQGFSYEIRDLWTISPTMTERDAPVVRSVAKAIGEVMGVSPEYVVSPGTYDQKHIDRIGRLKNCIAYGPGILDLAHQPDEWVGVDDMLVSAKVMALALLDLLGPRP